MICFAVLFAKSDRQFGWTNPEARRGYPVMSDGSGYYAYLPQWFTFHTDKFQFADSIGKSYYRTRFVEFAGYPPSAGEHYNKYYPGSAICLTPFYLAGQVHASVSGHVNDGFSWPYLLWCNIGMIFFALFGAYALFRLSELYKLKPVISYLLVLVVLFGTNVCYYTTVEIPFSHVFCFAINTWILLLAKRWSTSEKSKHFYGLCLLLGLTVIIRPTNVFIILTIPFLFPSFRSFWSKVVELFRTKKTQLLIGFMFAVISIVFLYWNAYSQTGLFVLNSYSNETFVNWKDPYIFDVLFSYRKGLFVFTPVLFLLLPALVVSYFRERQLFWMNLIIFSLVTYSTASWWMWWFGGGLGSRNYIDFMGIFILTIGVMIHQAPSLFKVLSIGALFLSTWMYQVYDYQMRYNILHYSDISKEGFWEVFLKTDHRFQWYIVIPYDKKPRHTTMVGHKIWLLDANGKPIRSRILEINKDEFSDDPKLSIPSKNICSSDNKIGMSFKTDVRIYDHFTSPSVNLFVYLKGKMIEEKSFAFGGKIPNQNEFASPELYVNLKTKWSEVDSIVVWFNQGLGNVGVKNQFVQFYKY